MARQACPSLPHTPTLTDVSPVVGVPCTLVVSKAQLHLQAVGRRETQRKRSQWDPVIQAPAFTLVLGQALRRKGRGKSGEPTELVWGVLGLFPPHSHESHRKQG